MKKLAIFLTCIMLVLAFTSCGKDKAQDTKENSDKTEDVKTEDTKTEGAADTSATTGEEISKGDYSDFATALSTFVTDYLNTKTPCIDAISASENAETANLELLGLYMADLNVVEVPMYDALDLTGTGGNKVTGNLMLSGFEATKEKDGDKIRFGYTHTYEEDQNGNLKGDILESTGYLDTKAKVLVMESTRTRAGQLSSRSVMEIARLKNDDFVMQTLHFDGESMAEAQDCVFLRTSTKNLTAVLADGKPVVDFEYASFIDKADLTPEEMAKAYTTTLTLTVDGTEVTIVK